MYPGTARPSGAYVGQMPQNVLPGSVPVTQDAGRVLGSGTRRGYPDMARAAGIQVFTRRDLPYYYSTSAQRPWIPPHSVFPLKAFRGADYTVLYIEPSWDDAKLLQELKKTYDSLRGLWRRCFSLKNVQCITMVLNTHTFIYPQRIGGASVTPHHNLRFRCTDEKSRVWYRIRGKVAGHAACHSHSIAACIITHSSDYLHRKNR
ncbi:hypothetical protein CERSUDRAFT_67868 [Gelatoporia subvermispora B]|uniref:Uncharacterized protein n=1 Tax=Ceriporiopsis subvermispora (strain B) TaxID=914234 RepID=M2QNI8_CERS8|nr:hypothetical protein CERSUDRAFT_67868 [Gelatoporia subvermispora B]